jgi:class 3 adenylate cyclase
LERLGIAQYGDRFEADDIDLDVVPSLSKQDLEKLGVSMGHRKRLLKAMAELTGPPASPVASDRTAAAPTPAKHLADKILHSKSALEGERKQVTVLFADVKGSMELAEQLDPEEWSRIMQRFFTILADGVERFEGFVDKFTGDGIMALFGAPIAHEDHAQRACFAALHLRDELQRYADELRLSRGIDFSVRMGINSGAVVVGKIGDDLRTEYTAQGHTVGLAQRMEQLAAAQTICLSEATAKAVAGYVTLRDLGPAKIKGATEPVRVFELEGMSTQRTRLEVARVRGLTRFVGRAAEMDVLEAALARARAGNGQVIGVVAEAGTGKSRLCFEFAEHCRAAGMRVIEGRCAPYGQNIPLLPILQVFRHYYGITGQDSDQSARAKLAGHLLLLDDGYREVLPVLFEFFGVPDPDRPVPHLDPEVKQRQLFGVLRKLVQRGAEDTVALIEDLHWIDGASAAWLEEWVDAIAGTRFVLVVNFRPEFAATWVRKSYYQQLPLAPLNTQAVHQLLASLLGPDPSITGLADAIHARTGGNPFFTEEVVQSLRTTPCCGSDERVCMRPWRERPPRSTPRSWMRGRRCWRTTASRPARRGKPRSGTSARRSGPGSPTPPRACGIGSTCAACCGRFRIPRKPCSSG